MTVASAPVPYARGVVLVGSPDDEQQLQAAEMAVRFSAFLPHWKFVNRETGAVQSFRDLWPGQQQLTAEIDRAPLAWWWILKAGKLGFSELECAFDGWTLRFRQPNCRVHLFSRGQTASRELLKWVRFGLENLPPWLRLPVAEGAGAYNSTSLILYAGPYDKRQVVSWPASPDISIDQSCQHMHVDEFARMPHGQAIWQAIGTTVAPGGSCHIVTRGKGPNYAKPMFEAARDGRSQFRPFFAPYDARPGRDAAWLALQAQDFTEGGIRHFAPATWQEALQGDASYVYPQFENPVGRHIRPCYEYELRDCPIVAVGVDLGGGTPTAMTLGGELPTGRTHQFDEFYEMNVGTDAIEYQLAAWEQACGQRLLVAVDPTALTLIQTLIDHGFNAVPADNRRIEGIGLVKTRLNTGGFTIDPRCRRTIDEFYDYKWLSETDAETKVEYAGDRPMRHHADAMDALRYSEMALATVERFEPVTLPSGRVIYGRA